MEQVNDGSQWSFPVEQRQGVAILAFPSDAYNRINDPVARATFLIQAQQEIEDLVQQTDHPKLLVSFDDVAIVTSGLLGILVQVNKLVNDRGGQFHIVGLQPRVSEVFSVMNLDKLLKIHPTVDEALKEIGES